MPSFAVGHSYLVRVEMNIDLNKPQFLTQSTIGALVFAGTGMYWAYCSDWLLAGCGIVLGICMGFMYKGIGIDLPGKRYRTYTGFFNYRHGAWEPLPAVSGVTVKYFSELVVTSTGRAGAVRTDADQHYILMLSVANSPVGLVLQRFKLNERDNALVLSNRIAEILQVPLYSFL